MNGEAVVYLRLLGPLEVTVAGVPMPVGGPGRRALLAALGLSLDHPVGVAELMEYIWDDRPPATAITKLHGHVSALRQALARLGAPEAVDVLQTRSPGYALCARRAHTDLSRFDELVSRAMAARLPAGAAVRARGLADAIALWRDTACADIPSARAKAASALLDERRCRAAEDLAEARLTLGDHHAVIDAMRLLVRRAPYRELAWEYLMRAHLRRGDVATALATYGELCRILDTDLRVTPGRRISRLAESIRVAHAPTHR